MKRLFPGIERIWLDAENIPIPQDIRHFTGDNSLLAQTLVRRGLKTFEKAGLF